MKIFQVGKDGELKAFSAMDPEKGGGIFEAKWRICYKISEDGTNVNMTITDIDEKHRGGGEASLLGKYFDVRDYDPKKNRTVFRKEVAHEEDVSLGFGQDPDGAGEGILSEKERARQQEINRPETETENPPGEKVTL